MRFKRPSGAVLPLALLAVLDGCATTIDDSGIEERTASAVGRPVGSFTNSDRSEESGGRINDTVKTCDGAIYRCNLYSPTAFVKVMSFGQTPNSDAICSAMGHGPWRCRRGRTCAHLQRPAQSRRQVLRPTPSRTHQEIP